MKRLALLIAGLVGLASGAFLGSRSGLSGPAENDFRAEQRLSVNDPAASFGSGAAGPTGEDPRVVKLFTALRDPLLLRRRCALAEGLQNFGPADMAGLIARAEALPEELGTQMLQALLRRWFEIDFDAAQGWLHQNRNWLGRVGPVAAEIDPEATIRAAQKNPGEWNYVPALVAAIQRLAGDDPSAQVAKLKTLPPGVLRDRGMGWFLCRWGEKDPAAALRFFGEVSRAPDAAEIRNFLLTKLSERDPAAALGQLSNMMPELTAGVHGNRMVIEMAERIAAKDPQLILDWLADAPIEFRATAGVAAARAWAKTDPIAALEWCAAHEVDLGRVYRDDYYNAKTSVLGEALANAPAKTMAWLEALPAGAARDRLMERALHDALLRAPAHPSQSSEDNMRMRLFRELPPESQWRAATQIGEALGRGSNLTDLDGLGAQFPSGQARSNAIAGAIGAAYKSDASRVEPLLASVNSVSDRNAAVRGLAIAMTETAPLAATARAMEITDNAARDETLDTIVFLWMQRDPAAARSWLENAPAAIASAWRESVLQNASQ
jgi:hypothetical protein